MAEHFPHGSLDTVSSALFLRFINPAIVSPQSYNLVQGDVPNGARRGLTFISKVYIYVHYMYVYVAPPTLVGAWSMALVLQQHTSIIIIIIMCIMYSMCGQN